MINSNKKKSKPINLGLDVNVNAVQMRELYNRLGLIAHTLESIRTYLMIGSVILFLLLLAIASK
jgi:hypothetical protein